MSEVDKICKRKVVHTLENADGYKQPAVVTCTHKIELEECCSVDQYVKNIIQWHYDRNLIDGSTDKDQYLKLIQEAGELSDNICKGKNISDDIGDMVVVLLNIAERNGLSLQECLAKAWDDIKDRKGRMIDGIFVKEGD